MASEFEKFVSEKLAGSNTCDRHIAEAAWNAALAAVAAGMPEQRLAEWADETGRARGWNECRGRMSERLAALKETR